MDKGKLARILYKTATGETTAEGWHWEEYGAEYFELAEAVLKALEAEPIKTNIIGRTIRPPMYLGDSEEADAPKELMDCILSPEEANEAWVDAKLHDDIEKDICIHAVLVCNKQLKSPKLKAYIEAVKKAERERIIPLIIQYSRAEISIDTLLKKIKGGE